MFTSVFDVYISNLNQFIKCVQFQKVMTENLFSEFADAFCSKAALLSVGWQFVPTFDGTGRKTWHSIHAGLRAAYMDEFICPTTGWIAKVIEIQNQEIFQLQKNFSKMVRECEETDCLQSLWSRLGRGTRIQHVNELEVKHEILGSCKPWSFRVDHLCKFDMPATLQFRAVAAIFGRNQWLTEGHREDSGDDSVAAVLFGQKVFIYAGSISSSIWLIRMIKTPAEFMELIKTGSPHQWRHLLYVHLSTPGSIIAQTSLWAHTVLTVLGPSIVVGWEAGCLADTDRFSRVAQNFAFGMGKEQLQILRNVSLRAKLQVAPQLSGDSGQLFNRELELDVAPKPPNPRTVKKKRWSHLPSHQKAAAKKEEAKRKRKEVLLWKLNIVEDHETDSN